MAEEKRTHVRRMDDLGNINIPKEIQNRLGLKATELPEFVISLNTDDTEIQLKPIKCKD